MILYYNILQYRYIPNMHCIPERVRMNPKDMIVFVSTNLILWGVIEKCTVETNFFTIKNSEIKKDWRGSISKVKAFPTSPTRDPSRLPFDLYIVTDRLCITPQL